MRGHVRTDERLDERAREAQSAVLLGATLLGLFVALLVGGAADALNRLVLHAHVLPAAVVGFAVGLSAAGAVVIRHSTRR